MVTCMDDDSQLKATNLGVLMLTRSEDSRVRLFALGCAVAIWQSNGKKLSGKYLFPIIRSWVSLGSQGFGLETATFIMECAEDDNDDVVRECHRLKNAVEAEIGKIDGL